MWRSEKETSLVRSSLKGKAHQNQSWPVNLQQISVITNVLLFLLNSPLVTSKLRLFQSICPVVEAAMIVSSRPEMCANRDVVLPHAPRLRYTAV